MCQNQLWLRLRQAALLKTKTEVCFDFHRVEPKTSLKLRQVVTSINLENELTPVSLARLQTVA